MRLNLPGTLISTLPDAKSVHPHDKSGDDVRWSRRASRQSGPAVHGRRCDALARRGVVRENLAANIEGWELDLRLIHAEQFLRARASRVEGDADSRAGNLQHVRHVHFERRDVEAELARHADIDVAAQETEDIHRHIERSEDADQVRRHAAA